MHKLIKPNIILIFLAVIVGLFFRFWHIEFGLPHSFYADEPEIVEPAIKYTYDLRNILKEKNYHELIPISFVYGTFPTYLNTFSVMGFSKISNLVGHNFDKMGIYVFARGLNAVLSMILLFSTGLLTKKLFKSTGAAIISVFLVALNWKLIVHAHYVNADITQTFLLGLAYLTLLYYYKSLNDTKFTVFTGILFGLAVGTKITTLLGLPLFLYIFLVKKDWRAMSAFVLITLGAFIVSNPFSFIFSDRFFFRIMEMFTKEAGMVFDSVNLDPLKYVKALGYIATPLILLLSLYGKLTALKKEKDPYKEFHIFLIAHVVLYLAFFSIQNRLVERWLLPILPIVLSYAAYALNSLASKKLLFVGIILIALGNYLKYPLLLLDQFQRHTPKSDAYVWMRDNTDPLDTKLTYTEEGLDPLNKLESDSINKVIVYTDESAQFFMPKNPEKFDYIILASRPMLYHKNPVVKNTYPLYAQRWAEFEQKVLEYEVVKEFTLPKPNLVPLSDVVIYKNP